MKSYKNGIIETNLPEDPNLENHEDDDLFVEDDVIKVFGVGGAGVNTIKTLMSDKTYKNILDKIKVYALNTDFNSLKTSGIPNKIGLGKNLLRGKGAGADIELGKSATIESEETIKKHLEDADLVFITAGMGGGTGTLSAGKIAEFANDIKDKDGNPKEILTIAVVSTPFASEGREKSARLGLESLAEHCNSIIILDNEKYAPEDVEEISLIEVFKRSDRLLCESVHSLVEILTGTQVINTDYNDIKTVLTTKGSKSVISTSIDVYNTKDSSSDDIVNQAVDKTLQNPLLQSQNIKGAKQIILYLNTSPNTPMSVSKGILVEVQKRAQEGNSEQDEKPQIFLTVDETFEVNTDQGNTDQVNTDQTVTEENNNQNYHIKLTIIATGIDLKEVEDKKETDSSSVNQVAIDSNPQSEPQVAPDFNNQAASLTHQEVTQGLQNMTSAGPQAEVTPPVVTPLVTTQPEETATKSTKEEVDNYPELK